MMVVAVVADEVDMVEEEVAMAAEVVVAATEVVVEDMEVVVEDMGATEVVVADMEAGVVEVMVGVAVAIVVEEAEGVEAMVAEDIDRALVEMTRSRRMFTIDKCTWLLAFATRRRLLKLLVQRNAFLKICCFFLFSSHLAATNKPSSIMREEHLCLYY